MIARKKKRRAALRARANYACEYCHITENLAGGLLTEDHLLPPDLGGADDLDNLCWCCFRCNVHKGQRTVAIDSQTAVTVPLFNPRLHVWADVNDKPRFQDQESTGTNRSTGK
jgi:5-methylcytosine-specific restriction endonuclease McrA